MSIGFPGGFSADSPYQSVQVRTSPYNFSSEHVQELKLHCFHANLSMPELFRFATAEELQSCYNGIGPDRWSSRFRRFTTWILTFLEAPALIHDWEYTYQPKNYGAFTMANLRLAYNAAKDRHPFSGITAAVLCQLFGWRSFKTEKRDERVEMKWGKRKAVQKRITGEEAARQNMEILSRW